MCKYQRFIVPKGKRTFHYKGEIVRHETVYEDCSGGRDGTVGCGGVR